MLEIVSNLLSYILICGGREGTCTLKATRPRVFKTRMFASFITRPFMCDGDPNPYFPNVLSITILAAYRLQDLRHKFYMTDQISSLSRLPIPPLPHIRCLSLQAVTVLLNALLDHHTVYADHFLRVHLNVVLISCSLNDRPSTSSWANGTQEGT